LQKIYQMLARLIGLFQAQPKLTDEQYAAAKKDLS
jgi:hypothetical protein